MNNQNKLILAGTANIGIPNEKNKFRSASAQPRFKPKHKHHHMFSPRMAENKKTTKKDKPDKRPITSSSVSFTNSLEDSSKESVSNSPVTMYRPGRPGFSGSKLKMNQRSKSLATYTARPIVPAEKPELISVAEAMHQEKFGERLQSLFSPETEAAIKALESGVYVGWRCAEFTWDCIRVGEMGLCFCGHPLKQHRQYNGPKSQVPCSHKGCRCRAFSFIPSRPEDVGEFWLQRRPGYDPSTWTAKCRCKHSHINHSSTGIRSCTVRGCRCGQFESNFLCAACDRHWEEHETYFDTEKTRVEKGLPHGAAYIPFAEIPRLRNMALTGSGNDNSSFKQLTGSSNPPAIRSKPADNNTPVPFGYYSKTKKSPFDS